MNRDGRREPVTIDLGRFTIDQIALIPFLDLPGILWPRDRLWWEPTGG